MDGTTLLLVGAVIVFAIEAWWHKSLVAVGLALFAGSFLVHRL